MGYNREYSPAWHKNRSYKVMEQALSNLMVTTMFKDDISRARQVPRRSTQNVLSRDDFGGKAGMYIVIVEDRGHPCKERRGERVS